MSRDLRIRMLFEASNRVTQPLRDIAQGAGRASHELKETRDKLKLLEAAQARVTGFRKLKTDVKAAEVALAAARTKVGQLAREMTQTDNPSRKLAADFARAKREAAGLKTEHAELTRRTQAMRTEMAAAGISTSNLANHERELRAAVDRTNTELHERERRLQRVTDRQQRMGAARESFARTQGTATGMVASGGAAIGIAVAAAAPVVASARAAMSLEEGMAGVAKVTGLADASLSGMQNRLVDLSTRIPMSAVDLSNIAAAAGAAGVGMDKFGQPLKSQADDLVAFTDAAARMGIAFDMSAEDAGSTMAKWRQAFKMPQAEVEALGDRVNALTNKFGGKADQVSDIITRIGPLGEVAGLAAPEIAALGSSLNSIGVENEVAATGIKNTLLTLTKGAAATKSQTKAFDQLGLSATDVAKRMQSNASGTIVDVLERIGKIKPEGQAAILSELFGTESVGAIAPLLTNLDGLKQRLGLVGDRSKYAGSMTNEFLSRINTTTGATDLAANALQSVNITLGQALLPNIKAGAQWIGRVAGRTRKWAGEHPLLAKGMMGAVVAGAALFAIVGVGMIVLAAFMTPLAIINAGLIAMGVAGGLASVGLLPILGTIALVVGAIALLAGATYLIYANWGAVSAYFTAVWNEVRATWAMASGFFTGLWSEISAGFSNGIGGIAALLINFSPVGLLYRGFAALMNYLGVQMPARLTGFGMFMMRGLVNGIIAGGKWVVQAIGNIGDAAVGWFKRKLGIHSPSRVFMTLGGHVVDGLSEGIDGKARDPARRIAHVAGRMYDAASGEAVRLPALSMQIGPAAGIAAAAPAMAEEEAPVRRVARVAGRDDAAPAGMLGRLPALATEIMAAIGVGAAAPAVAASGGGGMSPPVAPAAAGPITIHIHQQPGQSAQDLARAVEEVLAKRAAPAASANRSSYADQPDY